MTKLPIFGLLALTTEVSGFPEIQYPNYKELYCYNNKKSGSAGWEWPPMAQNSFQILP